MDFLHLLESLFTAFGDYAWGTPLLILLVGGGLYFTLYSRFVPFRYFRHAIAILRGKYDDPDDPGDLKHYEALATALAATVGMGNISGVAVAISMGGPGAIFWMWMSAIIGMATKFFTSTLAIMYRGRDSAGKLQGGPMYFITEGLGKKWRPLAVFFALAGLIGCLPLFQANQLTQTIFDVLLLPAGFEDNTINKLLVGLVITVIVGLVIFGGVKRIGATAGKLVPVMVFIYLLAVAIILLHNLEKIPEGLALIFSDAFTGRAVMGGALGAVIITGVRRAAFSNEAGIGTAPMAHGAAKTKEPVREGLIAMLGPFIDTIVVCTATAVVILLNGYYGTERYASVEPISGFEVEDRAIISGGSFSSYTNDLVSDGTLQNFSEGNGYLALAGTNGDTLTSLGPFASYRLSAMMGDTVGHQALRFSYRKRAGDIEILLSDRAGKEYGRFYFGEARAEHPDGASIIGLDKSDVWAGAVIEWHTTFAKGLPDSLYLHFLASGDEAADWDLDRLEWVRDQDGITLTLSAFQKNLPGVGGYVLMLSVLVFSLTTLFSYSYYGSKCLSFLLGVKSIPWYNAFYVLSIIFGSMVSLKAVIGLVDGMFALMAIPTMISAILLSPKVRAAAKDYFSRMKAGGS